MSIREDARNDHMLYDILGYDPRKEIENLRVENEKLTWEVKRLKDKIQRMSKFKQQ